MSFISQSKRLVSRNFPRLFSTLQGILNISSPDRRAIQRDEARAFRQVQAQLGDNFGGAAETGTGKIVLFFSLSNIHACVLESPVFAAFQKAGFDPLIFANRSTYLRRAYRLFGLNKFAAVEDYQEEPASDRIDALMDQAKNLEDLIAITDLSVQVGKYAASSLLRTVRCGTIDMTNSAEKAVCWKALARSVTAADAAKRIIDRFEPGAIVMSDRGYTPYGEAFDTAILSGIPVFTFCGAYRPGELVIKRYNSENVDRHFLTLSGKTWSRIQKMPWSDAKWRNLEQDFVDTYTKGDWFAEVGTQFNVEIQNRAEVLEMLALDPNKKTAILFAHIFWDATFFYGTDLFRDYEEWFCETLRKAVENDSVNWIIKVHPANTVKDQRDGANVEHGELTAIRRTLGDLPAHIKVLPADTTISTLSLFDVMDYCLTVRGTIGIEAACRGIRVLTAGTGRFDQCGFTTDFESRDDFLTAVGKIASMAPMSIEETELARRYAYGVFKTRSIPLTSVEFDYKRDAKAEMETRIRVENFAELLEGEDVTAIADWISSGDEDCCDWQSDERG